MTRTIPQWAPIQAHIDMALSYWHQGVSKEQILTTFKANKYIHQGFKYNATQIVAHMELLDRLDNGARKGVIKCTKSKGLHW